MPHLLDPQMYPSELTYEQEELFALPEGQDYAIQKFDDMKGWCYFDWLEYTTLEKATSDALFYRDRFHMRVVKVCRYLAGSRFPLVWKVVRVFDLRG